MKPSLLRLTGAVALLALGVTTVQGQTPAPAEPAPLTPAAPESQPSGIPQSGSATQAAPGAAPQGETDVEPASMDAATEQAAADFGPDALQSVEGISPFVGDVQVLGPWSDGDRRGIWRTVMLQSLSEVAGNRFFVQQIEVVNGAPTVSSTTEITEVGEIDGAVVGYRIDEPSAERPAEMTLFMDIVPLDGEVSETYELFYKQGEPYVFGPASN